LDDRTLVKGLLRGEPAAQAFFDLEYRPRLYRACCYILGYRDGEAEDVVQDTFMAVYDHLDAFEFRSSFYHWIYRICMHRCFEVIRKRRRQVASLDEDLENLSAKASLERLAREEDARRREEVLVILREERRAMEEPCRDLLALRDEEGNSYARLAETLRIPIGTVMSRLSRCKETLEKRVRKRLGWTDHGRPDR